MEKPISASLPDLELEPTASLLRIRKAGNNAVQPSVPSISSTLNLRFERFQMSLCPWSSDRAVTDFVLDHGSGTQLPGTHRRADRKELEMRAKRVKMGENGYRLRIGCKWVKMDIGHARNQEHYNHAGNT